ncbi:hypothetical protein [Haloferula sargassicola]|uniref:Uncharacterized protein n=1 Tax=Haloferula sargassicola TaxID=490096 RepID=A0ABP9UVG7_9BACT
MDTATTNTKGRGPARKAQDIKLAWKELAADATFGGKTLADLEAAIAAFDGRMDELQAAKKAVSAAVMVKNQSLADLAELAVVIALGVRVHENYGRDCPLYRAMGFVPKSERASGTVRKKQEPPAENNEAAV